MSARTLIQKIKRVFGLSDGTGSDLESESSVEETEVTVERTAETTPAETDSEPSSVSDETESATEDSDQSEPDSPESVSSESKTESPESESSESERADEDSTGTGEPVEKIKGIGPTYRDRLVASGFETVDDVAASDPETVAAAAETSEGRAEDWIKRAQNR